MSRCFFFGCWNKSGHFLFGADGHSPSSDVRAGIELFADMSADERWHLDGALAPRTHQRTGKITCNWHMAVTRRRRDARDDRREGGGAPAPISPAPLWGPAHSDECRQGMFLRHVLPNGFTAIQWWDRNQGDSRGACNSTVLLEGTHTTEEMLAALGQHFPHVLENLRKAGVELVEAHEDVP